MQKKTFKIKTHTQTDRTKIIYNVPIIDHFNMIRFLTFYNRTNRSIMNNGNALRIRNTLANA